YSNFDRITINGLTFICNFKALPVSHADLYVCHAVVCYIYDSSIRDTRHRDPLAAFLKHSFMAIGYTGFSYNDSVNDLWIFNFGSLYIYNLWAVEFICSDPFITLSDVE